MSDLALSESIEALLVERNLRNMAGARRALKPGYYLRAAQALRGLQGTVLIGTGFPVADTFETDGPVGAVALYRAVETLGAQPIIACEEPLLDVFAQDFDVLKLPNGAFNATQDVAQAQLAELQPEAVIAIERPGLAADAHYYNMRGDQITGRCSYFEPYFSQANCITIAIGDGGNEIGMGNIASHLEQMDVPASVTRCDELLLADVSNWGAYGLIALLAHWSGEDLLGHFSPATLLEKLVAAGGVDGVTADSSPTEDGLASQAGESIIARLRHMTGFERSSVSH